MSDAPQHDEAASGELNTDAYCPNCRYNLRGLSGDPMRCPECGGRYMRAELRWPKKPRVMTRQERARRDLQRRADLCALAVIPGLVGATVWLAGDYVARQLALPITVVSMIIWLIGFALLARRCRGLSQWGRALAVYHLAAVPAMVVNLALVAVTWVVAGILCVVNIGSMLDRLPGSATVATGVAVVAVLVIAGVLLPGLAAAWLVVRSDPMGGLKRLGADRLNALADRLAEQMPPPAGSTEAPPTDPTVGG
jgi:hypothetical protein